MAGIVFSESSGVNKSIYGESQLPIKKAILDTDKAFEKYSVIKDVFAMETSNKFAEKITGVTALGLFQPTAEGGAFPRSDMQENYESLYRHKIWKNSFEVTREMIDDEQFGVMKRMGSSFTNSFLRTREEFGAALLGGATKGTSVAFGGVSFSTLGADGAQYFATSHTPKVSGGAQSNMYAGAFSKDNLGKLETAMQNFKDDNGNLAAIAPDTILIPNIAELKDAVFAATGAEYDPDTANNGYNYQFGRWNIIVCPYLNNYITSGTAPWFLIDSKYNTDAMGAVWFDRVKLEMASHIDENTGNNIWNGYARFIAGFHDFRAMAVSGVSGATAL